MKRKSKKQIVLLFSIAVILLLTATVFKSSISAAPLPASLRQFGDVDGDGVIGTNDILLINKFRLNKTTFTTLQKEVADVNTDGKIDTEDILRINKHRLQGETNPAYKLITIYWEYKNASGTTVSKKYPYNGNSQIGTLFNPPARSGYRFDGWYTQASGGTKISSTYNVGTTSQILYAHYSIPVTGVTLNKKSVTIKVGETYKDLKATVSPSNATNKAVTWSSSNTAVATVNSNGQVKGIKAGTATITVKTKDGGKTASFKVTVNAATTWSMPMKNAYVCGNGWLQYYSARPSRPYHLGLDLASKSGDANVYAAADGKVVATGTNSANGKFVIIKHTLSGKTVYSFYCHLQSVSVSKNKDVKRGNKIGVYGNTGSASKGRHLHFAIVDTLKTSGSYYGYGTTKSGNKVKYEGVTYYNPNYVIKYNKLP